jgi:hypothetical protein
LTGPGKGWRRKSGPREPSGRLQRPRKPRPGRISDDDLAARIYPPEDVRNRPDVRRWLEEHDGPFMMPRGLPSVWLGERRPCPCCGRLTGV